MVFGKKLNVEDRSVMRASGETILFIPANNNTALIMIFGVK